MVRIRGTADAEHVRDRGTAIRASERAGDYSAVASPYSLHCTLDVRGYSSYPTFEFLAVLPPYNPGRRVYVGRKIRGLERPAHQPRHIEAYVITDIDGALIKCATGCARDKRGEIRGRVACQIHRGIGSVGDMYMDPVLVASAEVASTVPAFANTLPVVLLVPAITYWPGPKAIVPVFLRPPTKTRLGKSVLVVPGVATILPVVPFASFALVVKVGQAVPSSST